IITIAKVPRNLPQNDVSCDFLFLVTFWKNKVARIHDLGTQMVSCKRLKLLDKKSCFRTFRRKQRSNVP
ncbi:MAG TPA: hypothetical protein QGG18_08935, partial [Rhodospirillales bacterium]|nr:hypothetical protein [Rhodospirillales bacterium]